ncbi:hypothetical protein K469DRAFT_696765 [Zopfia rhizophila CBS 207.26]|uniref:non-specific serine/threonine protein kinase n=1 Tax=Zopfia rhizophila CBS 207.26 TaxID=1314779 RepID=A0A6A6EH43_9PEZI|nr:hypothetical protein K469DRAFT_696765 [Zopfia rhizophila CBS 207.26]
MALALSVKDFEGAVYRLISQSGGQVNLSTPLDEAVFDRIRKLLDLVGQTEWSKRPRTYILLLMIDRLDAMDAFVNANLFDIQFPYHESRLMTPLDDQESRERFLELQALVLTKATDVEKRDHKHFNSPSAADSGFIVKNVLGHGRNGVVDHVISKASLEEYARKRIRRRTLPRGQNATKDLESEIKILKRLQHHHFVKFVGSYTDPEYVGLLISPVAGSDLKFFLERKPVQEFFILQHAFGCLCAAVQYLHSQNCRHKDIKPANILLKDGKILLTDFGTSRDWALGERGTTTGRTGPYTPAYAAPEVIEWEPRNEAADIWSLGCVFLDMITVLKGKDLESKESFFMKTGTGNLNPRTNREAYLDWLAQLQNATLVHNEPIEWIHQMLKEGPRNRITASELLEQIRDYRDHDRDLTYYGHCCGGEESDVSSICHSSIASPAPETDLDRHVNDISETSSLQSEESASSTEKSSGEWVDRISPETDNCTGPFDHPSCVKALRNMNSPARETALGTSRTNTERSVTQHIHPQTAQKTGMPDFKETLGHEIGSFRKSQNPSPTSRSEVEYAYWQEQLQMRLTSFHRYVNRGETEDAVLGKTSNRLLALDKEEMPFSFQRGDIFPEALCTWIIDVCIQYYAPDTNELQMASLLCILILTFSFAFSTAGNCAVDLLPPDSREALVDFGREGRKIRSKFQRFLRKCEKSLRNEVLEGYHGDEVLPELDPQQTKMFLENTVGSQLETLSSIMEMMSDWCSEFKTSWLMLVLGDQISNDSKQGSERKPSYRVSMSQEEDHSKTVLSSKLRVDRTARIASPATSTKRNSSPLPISFCIRKDCPLCNLTSASTGQASADKVVRHKPFDTQVTIHRTTTSISRDFVNTTALKQFEKLEWVCGIRDHRCFLHVRYSNEIDRTAKIAYEGLQRDAPNLSQSFNIVPGRLTGDDIEELVNLTLKIRRARKSKQSSPRGEIVNDEIPGKTDLRKYRLYPASRSRTTLRTRPSTTFRAETSSKSHRNWNRYRDGYKLKERVPTSIHRITRRVSHYDLKKSDDTSLENTLSLIRKASSWFRKIAGGRRSAPPHEKAGSRGRWERE